MKGLKRPTQGQKRNFYSKEFLEHVKERNTLTLKGGIGIPKTGFEKSYQSLSNLKHSVQVPPKPPSSRNLHSALGQSESSFSSRKLLTEAAHKSGSLNLLKKHAAGSQSSVKGRLLFQSKGSPRETYAETGNEGMKIIEGDARENTNVTCASSAGSVNRCDEGERGVSGCARRPEAYTSEYSYAQQESEFNPCESSSIRNSPQKRFANTAVLVKRNALLQL